MVTKRSLGLIRDAGLRRIRTVTGWAAAGALAGTGIFVGLAAHSTPVSASAASKANAAGATSTHRSSVRRSHDAGGGQGSFPTQLAPNPAPVVQPASSGANSPLVSGAS